MLLTDCIRTRGTEGELRGKGTLRWRGGAAYSLECIRGGAGPETGEECTERLRRETKSTGRAVTAEDYERLVMRTPGLLIRRVKAVGGQDNRMELFVEGGAEGSLSGLSRIYRREIRAWLEEKRMLGTGLVLKPPEYIPVCVRAELRAADRDSGTGSGPAEAIREFFRRRLSDFGAEFRYSELYGILDGLSCVEAVRSLTVTASGKDIRFRGDGSFRLPDCGLAVLEEVSVQLVQEKTW